MFLSHVQPQKAPPIYLLCILTESSPEEVEHTLQLILFEGEQSEH